MDKPIERVRKGDKVWAQDMVTGKKRLRTVLKTFSHVDTRMMTLVVASKTVRVTTEHPFHTPDRGWVSSGELKVGDRLTRIGGAGEAQVDAITRDSTPTRVYNFSVAGNRNYAVTGLGLLVHNAECPYAARATQIHAAERDVEVAKRKTVAVVRFDTTDGPRDVIAGSGDGLTDDMLDVPLRPGEMLADNIPNTHAEQNAFLFGNAQPGWTPVAGGTSRSVCRTRCLPWISSSGGAMRGDGFMGNGKTTTRQRGFGWW